MKFNFNSLLFGNFNYKFFFLFLFITLLLSVKSKIDRVKFTIGDTFDDKIHIGSVKGKLFYSPYFLLEKDRIYHQSIFGVTGSGKTVSVLYPQIKHDIRTKKFTIILEPKGDTEFRDYVYSCCKKYNRKFRYISIGASHISSGYNPFGFGDANAVKDKILSSTDWSEQFYKKIADSELLKSLSSINKGKKNINNRLNYNGFNLKNIMGLLPEDENLKGLKALFESLQFSSFSKMFHESAPTMFDFYNENSVVFVSLDSLSYPEVSSSLGRLVLQDITTLGGYIFANVPKKDRKLNSLTVDEFATFYSNSFLPFLSQIRAAGWICAMANQSAADFSAHGEGVLARIGDNTSTKIYMAAADPDSAEYMARTVGTEEVIKTTKQVDNDLKEETGRGSSRDAHKFLLSPDKIKGFQTGEAYIYVRTSMSRQEVELDTFFYDDIVVEDYANSTDCKNFMESQLIINTKNSDSNEPNINKEKSNEIKWN